MNIKDLSSKIVDLEEPQVLVDDNLTIDVKPVVSGSKTGFYKEFFPEGQLKSTAWWHKGLLNGEVHRYDVYGNLKEHAYYKNSVRVKLLGSIVDGLQENRFDNKLIESAQYKDYKLNGEYKRWENGRLILHGLYKEDKLIKKIEDGREFNSLVNGENEMNEELNKYIDYEKYNLSFGRYNENKSEFIVPAFPGENHIKEFKKIITNVNIMEDVTYDGSNYYFYIK